MIIVIVILIVKYLIIIYQICDPSGYWMHVSYKAASDWFHSTYFS